MNMPHITLKFNGNHPITVSQVIILSIIVVIVIWRIRDFLLGETLDNNIIQHLHGALPLHTIIPKPPLVNCPVGKDNCPPPLLLALGKHALVFLAIGINAGPPPVHGIVRPLPVIIKSVPRLENSQAVPLAIFPETDEGRAIRGPEEGSAAMGVVFAPFAGVLGGLRAVVGVEFVAAKAVAVIFLEVALVEAKELGFVGLGVVEVATDAASVHLAAFPIARIVEEGAIEREKHALSRFFVAFVGAFVEEIKIRIEGDAKSMTEG